MSHAINTNFRQWCSFLLLLYFLILPFTRFWYLPIVYAKIQPTELVFLALLPLALLAFSWQLVPDKRWRLPLFFYLFINLWSGIYSGKIDAVLEGLGRVYLVVLFLITTTCIIQQSQEKNLYIGKMMLYGGIAMSIISIVGYVAAVLGYPNETVQVFGNYPYLGTTLRSAGLTGGSGMLAVVLTPGFLYAWVSWREKKGSFFWIMPFAIVLLLTFAKEVLLVSLGVFLLDPLSKYIPQGFRFAVVGMTALFFWLGTHILILDTKGHNDLSGTFYTSEKVLGEWQGYIFMESSYLALKQANLQVGLDHFWLGVGPGCFNQYLEGFKSEGLYPAHLPNYDPHSTWMGAFSETGILGLCALLWLSVVVIRHIYLTRANWQSNPLARVMVVFLFLLLIASISVDMMNFRQLWVALGIVVAASAGDKQS